jgi:hypothetical protein
MAAPRIGVVSQTHVCGKFPGWSFLQKLQSFSQEAVMPLPLNSVLHSRSAQVFARRFSRQTGVVELDLLVTAADIGVFVTPKLVMRLG